MKEFGKNYYKSFVYFNFDEEDELKSIFEANKNPQRILELLSLICGEKILPGETLIIFDEIQECPEALNTLKYFKESFNRFLIISLDVLICRYSPLFRAFPALFISEEPHKSFYYPSCFRSQK